MLQVKVIKVMVLINLADYLIDMITLQLSLLSCYIWCENILELVRGKSVKNNFSVFMVPSHKKMENYVLIFTKLEVARCGI